MVEGLKWELGQGKPPNGAIIISDRHQNPVIWKILKMKINGEWVDVGMSFPVLEK